MNCTRNPKSQNKVKKESITRLRKHASRLENAMNESFILTSYKNKLQEKSQTDNLFENLILNEKKK
tara:strand:- start:366 stop:563 length:198 start_codon:yes stop_codon:yes gene_type:complete